MKSIYLTCLNCNNEFKVFYCHRNRYTFCSRKCKTTYTNGNIKKHDYNGKPYLEIKVGPKAYMKYHRFIMEQHLGRKLSSNEIVHHKDGNTLNNDIKNLVVTDRGTHMTIHKTIITEHKCQWCKRIFYRHTRRKRKFCSLSCTGKYGASLRRDN